MLYSLSTAVLEVHVVGKNGNEKLGCPKFGNENKMFDKRATEINFRNNSYRKKVTGKRQPEKWATRKLSNRSGPVGKNGNTK